MRHIETGNVLQSVLRALLPMASLLIVGATANAYSSALNPLLQEESPAKIQGALKPQSNPSTAQAPASLKPLTKPNPTPKVDEVAATTVSPLVESAERTEQGSDNEPLTDPSSDRTRSSNPESNSSDEDGSWATSPRYSHGMPI